MNTEVSELRLTGILFEKPHRRFQDNIFWNWNEFFYCFSKTRFVEIAITVKAFYQKYENMHQHLFKLRCFTAHITQKYHGRFLDIECMFLKSTKKLLCDPMVNNDKCTLLRHKAHMSAILNFFWLRDIHIIKMWWIVISNFCSLENKFSFLSDSS